MRKLIFDIETCSYPFESLSETQREYLLKYADKEIDSTKKEAMKDEAIRYTSLYPFTAKCIAIGMYDVEKEKSYVYYESEKPEEWNSENTNVQYKGLPEKEMLESFWRVAQYADQLVTRKFNLDFYCHAFGIESPKSKDISGMEVKTLYEAGRIKDIAVYCSKDIYATYQLFKIWEEYLK